MFFYLANRLAGQPLDIWHDPNAIIALISVGVGVVAILVSIALAFYTVRQGRVRRKLWCQRLSNAPLVSVNSAEIEVRFKGTPIKDANLVIVNIKNAGNESIRPSDYFEPLTFKFDPKVLQASILKTTPQMLIDLPTYLTLTPNSVQFPNLSLNPKDSIQISILLDGKGTLKVRGRIDKGTIVELEEPEESRLLSSSIFMLALFAAIFGVSIESVIFFAIAAVGQTEVVAGGILLIALAILLGIVSIVLRRRTTL